MISSTFRLYLSSYADDCGATSATGSPLYGGDINSPLSDQSSLWEKDRCLTQ
jgi:hypothetical protein